MTPTQPTHEYEVWMEGYSATGDHSNARLLGKVIGANFGDAIQKLEQATLIESRDGKWYIWGCRLFDNEIDARKTFG